MTLRRDLDGIFEDLEFQKSGGTVRYLVDFSEIYAYGYPDKAAKQVKFFRADPDEEGFLAQLNSTENLLRRTEEPIILPEPYERELDGLLDRLVFDGFAEFASDANEALREINELATSGEIPSGPASPKNIKDRIAFLQGPIPTRILKLLQRTHANPVRRFQQLLSETRFSDLSELFPDAQIQPTEQVVSQWVQRITRYRSGDKRAATFIDALAVAMLFEANSRLSDRRVRLRLVSRSSTMRRAIAEVTTEQLIRHPRAFAAFDPDDRTTLDDNLARVRKLREILGDFARCYEAHKDKTGRLSLTQKGRDDLASTMAKVKKNFHNRLHLTTWLSEVAKRFHGNSAKSSDERDKLMQLLLSSASSNEIVCLVQNRILELEKQMRIELERLGATLELASVDGRQLLRGRVFELTRVSEGKSVLRAKQRYGMLYTLQFRSQKAIELGRSFAEDPRRAARQMVNQLRSAKFDSVAEARIFMAFIYAISDRWHLAESYCSRALTDEPGDLLHEALFLKSVCVRMNDSSVAGLQSALGYIRRAHAQKAKNSPPDYEDPRYLKEEALLNFQLHLQENQPRQFEDCEGIAISERAILLIKNDRWLEAQLVNNMCYFAQRAGAPPDRVQAYYERLVRVMLNLDSEPDEWPAMIIDTLVYTSWKLRNRVETPKGFNDPSYAYGLAFAQPHLRQTERLSMLEHVEEMRTAGLTIELSNA